VYHRHSHESYSFGVTDSGAQAFTCRHGRHVSGAGMVMTFNPDDPHDGHAASDGGFTYRMVHIWPEFFARLLGDAYGGAVPLPLFRSPVLNHPAAAGSLRHLHAALTGPSTKLERYERLTAAARFLVRHGPGTEVRTANAVSLSAVPFGAGPQATAARIRDLIHDSHPGANTDLTVEDLAAAAGCSRYAAYRAFTQVYGLAPSDYQRQLRMRMARGLLADGIPPALAAARAGFADQAHLTRWFRRYYGVSPGAYRAAMHSPAL
jgi:AraC-like DNA-binding protein